MSNIRKYSQQEPAEKVRRLEEKATQSTPGPSSAVVHPAPRITNKTGLLLNNYILHDIFGYLNRKDLCCLPLVCRRFKFIIDADFAEMPYFISPYILQVANYGYYKYWRYARTALEWTWRNIIQRNPAYSNVVQEIPEELVDLLPKLRFIRFKKNLITCAPSQQSTKTLQSISHVWQDQDLVVRITQQIPRRIPRTIQHNLINLFTKSSVLFLDLDIYSVTVQAILAGNCSRIHILDTHRHRLRLSTSKVVGFLFRSENENNDIPREVPFPYLSIRTAVGSTSDQYRNELFEAIGQVFIKTRKPMNFEFGWFEGRNFETPSNDEWITRTLEQPDTAQKLCLCEYESESEFRIRVL
ncbi:hypothetical protein Ddc_10847 [Ditylenchus destructor]|nr:hypothetical protein Ddc_10847 [Ditylenchus destructor]